MGIFDATRAENLRLLNPSTHTGVNFMEEIVSVRIVNPYKDRIQYIKDIKHSIIRIIVMSFFPNIG